MSEGEETVSATIRMEYMESSASVEILTITAPAGLRVQESNIDLSSGESFSSSRPATSESPTTPTSISQHPAPIPRHTERSPKFTFGKSIQLKCGNWKTGLEVGMLFGVVVMVWMLFSIPIIFYVLPPSVREVIA